MGSHHSKQDPASEAQAVLLEEQEKKLRDELAPHKVHKEAQAALLEVQELKLQEE